MENTLTCSYMLELLIFWSKTVTIRSTLCVCVFVSGGGILRSRILLLTAVVILPFSFSHLSSVQLIAAAAWDQNCWQIFSSPHQSASFYITWLHQHWVWNMPYGNGSLQWQTNHCAIVSSSITTSSASVFFMNCLFFLANGLIVLHIWLAAFQDFWPLSPMKICFKLWNSSCHEDPPMICKKI